MIYGLLKKNMYQDSVNLMLLSSKLSKLKGINKVSIMMGTPANKDIFKNTNMYAEEFSEAGPNDICISVDTEDKTLVGMVSEELESFIKDLSAKSSSTNIPVSRSLDGAINSLPGANIALVSIPGEYVYSEVDRILDKNINAFVFSDNVSIEDEKKLKEKAHSKGLLVMGPDCGTGIISGVPLAFANVVGKGNIGIVGASGTGIQEVSSIIARLGKGVSHAIGIGGRDLSKEIGGVSALDALDILERDEDTDVVVFISKPPAESVKNKVIEKFKSMNKKIVAIFLGEKPEKEEANIKYVWTLEDAARQAVLISEFESQVSSALKSVSEKVETIKNNEKQRKIQGYFCGGTLAGEAAILIKEYLGKIENNKSDGFMLNYDGHQIIDFGDDMYTKGRPHPMIDPTTRINAIESLITKEDVAVVLIDNVIGYGSNDDMAGSLIDSIEKVINKKKEKRQEILFVASVCGTEEDIQVYSSQVEKLEEAGVIVLETNAQATSFVTRLIEKLKNEKQDVKDKKSTMLTEDLKVINIGLESFSTAIKKHEGEVIQYNWAPVAGGDKKLQNLLAKLNSF